MKVEETISINRLFRLGCVGLLKFTRFYTGAIQSNWLVCGFLFVCSFLSWGSETVLEIEQDSPNTSRAVQTALKKVSFDLMEQFIEPSKLKAKRKHIQRIISTYSNRYILYTQTGRPVQKEGKSFLIPVTIGFSEENLKKILLKEGLFYSGDSHQRILPLILFEDRVERESYGWWLEESSQSVDMKRQISEFYNQIQRTLLPYHFFTINPEFAGSQYFIPKNLLFTRPNKKDIFNLARFFQSSLVMTGSVKIRESDISSRLNVKITLVVYHTNSERQLAEIERSETITMKEGQYKPVTLFLDKQSEFAKGLGTQLRAIYESGQLSSHSFKLTVQGDLSYKNSNRFRQQLSTKVKDIEDLKENILRSQSITYIARTSTDIEVILDKLKKTVFPGFHVEVFRDKKNEITLEVTFIK